MQVFIFPNMIRYNYFVYFCDVAKMVIIHKKITTYGYRKILYLEKIKLSLKYYGYLLYFIVEIWW